MKHLLERLESAAGEAERVSIAYHIGSPFLGETFLELRGDGGWRLASNVTEGRRSLELEGELPPARVAALAGELIAARVWEARPQHEGRMQDEPLPTITVADGDDHHAVAVPASQVPAVEPFRAGQEAMLSLVRELSAGAVLETGR